MSLLNDPIASHYNSLRLKKEKSALEELLKIISEKDAELSRKDKLIESKNVQLKELDELFIDFKNSIPKMMVSIQNFMNDNKTQEQQDAHLLEMDKSISNIAEIIRKYKIFKNKLT